MNVEPIKVPNPKPIPQQKAKEQTKQLSINCFTPTFKGKQIKHKLDKFM